MANISSNLKLLADDTLLYGLVHNAGDAVYIQQDWHSFVSWAQEWQIHFHPSKYLQDQEPYYAPLVKSN